MPKNDLIGQAEFHAELTRLREYAQVTADTVEMPVYLLAVNKVVAAAARVGASRPAKLAVTLVAMASQELLEDNYPACRSLLLAAMAMVDTPASNRLANVFCQTFYTDFVKASRPEAFLKLPGSDKPGPGIPLPANSQNN